MATKRLLYLTYVSAPCKEVPLATGTKEAIPFLPWHKCIRQLTTCVHLAVHVPCLISMVQHILELLYQPNVPSTVSIKKAVTLPTMTLWPGSITIRAIRDRRGAARMLTSPSRTAKQVLTSVSDSGCRLGCPISVQTRANTESQQSETWPYHETWK